MHVTAKALTRSSILPPELVRIQSVRTRQKDILPMSLPAKDIILASVYVRNLEN